MFFRPYRLGWCAVFGLSCLVNLLLLAPAMHMLLTYDYVLSSGSRATLASLLVFIIVLLICMWGLDYARQTLAERIALWASLDLQSQAFDYGINAANQRLPRDQVDLFLDIRTTRKFLGSTQLFAFVDAPWVPVFLAVEFLIHPYLGWVATGAALVTFLLALIIEQRSRQLTDEEQQHAASERELREASRRRSIVVNAHGMLKRIFREWSKKHDSMLQLEDEVSARIAFWSTLSKSSRMIAQVLILSVGAWLVLEEMITAGVMIMGSIVLTRALAPVEQCIGAWRPFLRMRRALGRIRQHMEPVQTLAVRKATPVQLSSGRLDVRDIEAGPPGSDKAVVEAVSFSVRPGEMVQIVGNNGTGKTTLLNVISGAWLMLRGKVTLGGVDVHQWVSEDRGRHIGYLPQPPGLLPGTVRSNITRWEEDVEMLREAVALAGCEQAFNQLPQHLDTMLVDGGMNLSTGMRQRIGLVRAIYGSPEVVLLDEPETGLDSAGRSALVEVTKELKKRSVALVVVSHQADLIEQADRILVLEGGKAMAYGTRDQLMGSGRGQQAKRSG